MEVGARNLIPAPLHPLVAAMVGSLRAVALALALVAFATARAHASEPRILVRDAGLSVPESVEYDSTADVYLVSNIDGLPRGFDDNGFISRIAPDGRVLALRWIDGRRSDVTLHAPKGMAIVGERLYVADIDHVRIFDRATGRLVRDVAVDGAAFLNGVTPAPGGGVYVSDSGFGAPRGRTAEAIHRVFPDGRVQTLVRDASLDQPNGLAAVEGGVLVVTFGANRVLHVDERGRIAEWSRTPRGALDGLVQLPDGRWVTSSWEGKVLYIMDGPPRAAGGDAPRNARAWRTLASHLESPADLGVDTKRRRILVPLFQKNAVAVVGY